MRMNYGDKIKVQNKDDDEKDRLGICQDRRDRRSCKIFPNCVKFWGDNANLLGNSS